MAKIGQERLENVASADDAASRWCLELYPHARDTVTEDVAPRHAKRTAALQQLSTNEREDDFQYAYERPSDAMAVLYLLSDVGPFDPQNPIEFECETDSSGNDVIYSDEPNARVVYVKQSTDVTKFLPSFTEAVATYLAHMLVNPLRQDKQLFADMLNAYRNVAMPNAVAKSSREMLIIRDASESQAEWHRGR